MAKHVATDLTLADLLTRLPLGQLIGLIVGVSTLLGVAFAFGLWTSGKDDLVARDSNLQAENNNLKAAFDAMRFKDDFFQVFLRYVEWSTPSLVDVSLTSEQRNHQLENAKKAFADKVSAMCRDARTNVATPHKIQFTLSKGANDEVGVVTFVDDGVPWRVPPEIKRIVHDASTGGSC